jgi:hypothetical protein
MGNGKCSACLLACLLVGTECIAQGMAVSALLYSMFGSSALCTCLCLCLCLHVLRVGVQGREKAGEARYIPIACAGHARDGEKRASKTTHGAEADGCMDGELAEWTL